MYRRLIFSLFVAGILLSFYFPVNAQQGRFNFKNFSSIDGLPSSEVYQVFKDKKGYLWFATDHGVARFDGYQFETFSTEDNSTLMLYEDYRGRIWFITVSGRLYFFENGKVVPFAHNQVILDHLVPLIINDFYVDSSDKVYLSSTNPKSFWIDQQGRWDSLFSIEKNLRYKSIQTGKGFFTYVEATHFITPNYYFKIEDTSSVWLNIQLDNGPVSLRFRMPSVERRVRVKRIGDHILAAFKREQIYILEGNKVRLQIDCPSEVLDVLSLNDGNLLVGTATMGLLVIDPNGKIIDRYFPGSTISSLEKDHHGGYWATSTNNGIYFLPGDKVSQMIWKENPMDQPISFLNYLPKDSSLWIGTIGDRLYRMRPDRSIDQVPFSALHFHQVQYDSMMNAYLLGANFLVTPQNKYYFDRVNYERVNGLDLHIINSIAFLREGDHWTGVNSNGVFHINYATSYLEYKVVKRIRTVFRNKVGKVYMGNMEGLWEWRNDSLIPYRSSDERLKTRVTCLKEFRDRYLCVGTRGGGLFLVDGDSLYQFSRLEGMPSDNIRCIYGYRDQIWIGTNNGLAIIQFTGNGLEKFTIRKFNADNGLLSNEINSIAAYGNSVYLGTQKGLFQLQSSLFDKKSISPIPFHLRSIRINGEEQPIMDEYRLGRNKRNLEISFVALDYQNPKRIEYRYRLGDNEENWFDLSGREIQFNQLPYGRYLIEIQAKREFDEWTDAANIKLSIINDPPFWITPWFILLAGLLVSGAAYLIVRRRIRAIRKREREELDLHRKMTGIEIQAIRSQMNPHFIFNALNSIQYFISYNKNQEAARHLASFAQLVRKILDSSREVFIPLSEEMEMLRLYLEFEKLRFEEKFDFHLSVDPSIQAEQVLIPNMVIQPFVENAIKHGFKGLSRKGILEIRVTREEKGFRCIISDNGIGRERASLRRSLEKRDGQKSLGTLMTMEKKEALARLFEYDMDIEIRNGTGPEGEAEGTLVSIYFPNQKINDHDPVYFGRR